MCTPLVRTLTFALSCNAEGADMPSLDERIGGFIAVATIMATALCALWFFG